MLSRLAVLLAPRVALSIFVIAVLTGPAVLQVNAAPFYGYTTNPGRTWTAGTVTISDSGAGNGALLTLSNADLLATYTGCINVTYTGNAPANVKMYASVTGTGLGTYLDLTITRGTGLSGTFPSCTGFTADGATYAAASGVMYAPGTLGGWASAHPDWANGQLDPTTGSPESWTANEAHAYKFTITVQNNTAARGLNATPTFYWEARNT